MPIFPPSALPDINSGDATNKHCSLKDMKTLLTLLVMLTLPALGGVTWSHKVVEGEDGGMNANYFYYETFRPDYGDGTLMSVQRVRAIYALKRDGDVVVIDYFLQGGIRVIEMRAPRESLADLIAGKDVKFKKTSEFSVVAETSVGYMTSKNPKDLTDVQRERIFNLVYILSMQRSPIKSEQVVPSDGHKPSSRVPSDGPTAPADAH